MRGTVLLLAALLGGCSLLGPPLEAPNLDVVGIELLDSDVFRQRLKIKMRVQNPNARDLPVKGVSCEVEIDGQRLATGVSAAQFTVPAFGESEFDMVLTANMAGALVRLLGRKDAAREEIDYRITGKVNLASGLMRSIPFTESGSLRLN